MRKGKLAVFCLLAACGDKESPLVLPTPLLGPDGGVAVVGTGCVPAQESDPSFSGFALGETTVETSPGQPSGDAVCLAYHFQGRTSCPYGQSAPDAGAEACLTPAGARVESPVAAQCVDRRASDAVVWSCRCVNDQDRVDDGRTYCSCPLGTECVPGAVSTLGVDESTLAGGYCVPKSVVALPDGGCEPVCDPSSHPCP
ncbi:MAG TPA: hypothetical protein VGM06_03460 [Polyangiaceae bacterium]|jgi:hypothetical protein